MNSTDSAGSEVRELDRRHVFHSWSAQKLIDPVPIAYGEGVRFYDHSGNGYLDFSSQLVNANLGHQHVTISGSGGRAWWRGRP